MGKNRSAYVGMVFVGAVACAGEPPPTAPPQPITTSTTPDVATPNPVATTDREDALAEEPPPAATSDAPRPAAPSLGGHTHTPRPPVARVGNNPALRAALRHIQQRIRRCHEPALKTSSPPQMGDFRQVKDADGRLVRIEAKRDDASHRAVAACLSKLLWRHREGEGTTISYPFLFSHPDDPLTETSE